jgi:predicted alpha/beta-fold hydrolase
LFLFSGHLETIYPAILRFVDVEYTRERISTPDDDFLDLDWLKQGSKKVVIISHGLEGRTDRAYMKGMARAFFQNGFDVLTWNFRGCSDEMNRQLRFYHSGATEDLDVIVNLAIKRGYSHLYLIGFSLGGNLTLKYLGERNPDPRIRKAMVLSTPLDLYTSCLKISKPVNSIYARRFLVSLKAKLVRKSLLMSGLDLQGLDKIDSILAFDDRYTAPLHGFQNAMDYYKRCSSINFISSISIPTLILNAKNDPFLSELCYPIDQCKAHASVKLENPLYGGHVGFAQFNKNRLYWSEERALSFFAEE